MNAPRKAVALISGGLDSMLAARVMLEQGIHVEGINFFTGFCVEGHTHAIRRQDRAKPKRNNALWVAEQLGIRLHIVDVIEPYKDVVINPKHGYGQNLNPCLDCKGFMVGQARTWMEEHGFDFIITGEVIGQRPMSQRLYNRAMLLQTDEPADDPSFALLTRRLADRPRHPISRRRRRIPSSRRTDAAGVARPSLSGRFSGAGRAECARSVGDAPTRRF